MARDINFGESEADAKYQISDDGTPGNFVLARDTNGATVLLEWDATNSEWVFGGPVEMGSDGITTTGTVTAGSLSADKAVINEYKARATLASDQSVAASTSTTVTFDNELSDQFADAYDPSTSRFTAPSAGEYHVSVTVNITGVSQGDRILWTVVKDPSGSPENLFSVDKKFPGDEDTSSRDETVTLAEGDVLEVTVFIESTSGGTVTSGKRFSTFEVSREA